MNPERWRQVKELFQAAIEQDSTQRAAFLDGACAGDAVLREDVESLLACHDSRDSFLERPASEAAAALLENDPGELPAGHALGPYRVVRKLGQGGMGIVYLAEDSRLDRVVAIKALAPHCTQDPRLRERLQREARAAARLNHPGIAAVYALEEFGDDLYVVYEYVRGATLKDELARAPLPPPTLLDIGVRIADALAAAHEQGVVHRDLKPENVIRTPDGGIKILDFGLARIQSSQPQSAVSSRLTQAGIFLGTPAYASPEQLLGSEIDFRTDIFALGVMLYELAAGVHPFAGPDSVSVIARVLEAEPASLTQISPACPPELDQVIRRCLCKAPEQRYPATRHLLDDLTRLSLKISRPRASENPPREPRSAGPGGGATAKMLWWWQFHQACAGFGYYLTLFLLWKVRQWTPGIPGSLLFFPALAAAGVAANLRLHLWFSWRFYPAELADQMRRSQRWIRWSDVLFILLLLIGAFSIHESHAVVATLLVAIAIGSLVAFMLVEPATTRAAFGAMPEPRLRDAQKRRRSPKGLPS